jgi:beta-barrel assembly-enhancing protease
MDDRMEQFGGGRLIVAAIVAIVAIVSFFWMRTENPVTGEKQSVALTADQEIALGKSATPQLVQQYRGEYPSAEDRARVERVGRQLLATLAEMLRKDGRKNPYPFTFHLLRDERTINAFALPGGQVFITWALYHQLKTDAQLAGVLGHEIGHVLSRHGAQQLAKQKLTAGLAGAAGVASGDQRGEAWAKAVAHLVNMKYGRGHELEADRWGVRLMAAAGYDPHAMIEVMKILERASGGGGQPQFLSTHPKPANRIAYIKQVIDKEFPKGLPPGLKE